MKNKYLLVEPYEIIRNGGLVFALCILGFFAQPVQKANAGCENLFGSSEPEKRVARSLLAPVQKTEFGFDEFSVRAETHSLLDLVSSDPAENLVLQHPSIAMGAFQRTWSWFISRGTRDVYDSGFRREKRTVYRAISDYMPLNGGRIIVGQLESVETLANYIRDGAGGDSGARKKTLTLVVLRGLGKPKLLIF